MGCGEQAPLVLVRTPHDFPTSRGDIHPEAVQHTGGEEMPIAVLYGAALGFWGGAYPLHNGIKVDGADRDLHRSPSTAQADEAGGLEEPGMAVEEGTDVRHGLPRGHRGGASGPLPPGGRH